MVCEAYDSFIAHAVDGDPSAAGNVWIAVRDAVAPVVQSSLGDRLVSNLLN
jgi:hypothetical protein